MENKILVEVLVPEISSSFSVFLPINKKIGNLIQLMIQGIKDLTDNNYDGNELTALYNRFTGLKYGVNDSLLQTDIRNGSVLILL